MRLSSTSFIIDKARITSASFIAINYKEWLLIQSLLRSKHKKSFFQRQSTNKVTFGIGWFSRVGYISSIGCRFKSSGDLRWAKIITLWYYLDEVVPCQVTRSHDHVITEVINIRINSFSFNWSRLLMFWHGITLMANVSCFIFIECFIITFPAYQNILKKKM